jgi:Family of unknown function (DUF6510)
MDADGLRLDGNAAAGMLDEIFRVETTSAVATCAGCGASRAMGEVHVYAHGPGVVLRCPGCDAVVMRFARIRGRLVADMRGVRTVTF